MAKIKMDSKDCFYFELEKSRMRRENAMLLLNKSLIFYFAYLIIGILGFVNHYIDPNILNVLVLSGLAVLVIGTIPFVRTMRKEEDNINEIMHCVADRK
jgi:hypothetical protein